MFFFFLLISLRPVLQRHREESNFFSENGQSNLLFYVEYYLEVPSFLLNVQEMVRTPPYNGRYSLAKEDLTLNTAQ